MAILEKQFNDICNELATSSIGIVKICKKHGVSSRTFYEAIHNNKDYEKQYVRAREEQADFLADEIIEIADDSSNDTIYTEKGEFENKEWTNRSKLRVEARKWTASKLKPKKYGDKLELSNDPESPINTVVIFKLPDNGRGKEN